MRSSWSGDDVRPGAGVRRHGRLRPDVLPALAVDAHRDAERFKLAGGRGCSEQARDEQNRQAEGADGCPWDKKQTHASLREFLLEECYEVLAALDEGDAGKLCQELGDLLLQILLHAQIAKESKEFQIKDVIGSIATKLIRRHPHVFGKSRAANADEVAQEWEELKQNERKKDDSLLSSVPKGLPALSYSHSIQRRAAGIGFDWKEYEGILDKLTEEIRELQEASTQKERVHEFGDVLFILVNAARWQGVDLEEALRLANERFSRRFRYMEEACRKRGISLRDLAFIPRCLLWEGECIMSGVPIVGGISGHNHSQAVNARLLNGHLALSGDGIHHPFPLRGVGSFLTSRTCL
jgi:tetrapyrrole methylase family protein/MazG family protein